MIRHFDLLLGLAIRTVECWLGYFCLSTINLEYVGKRHILIRKS